MFYTFGGGNWKRTTTMIGTVDFACPRCRHRPCNLFEISWRRTTWQFFGLGGTKGTSYALQCLACSLERALAESDAERLMSRLTVSGAAEVSSHPPGGGLQGVAAADAESRLAMSSAEPKSNGLPRCSHCGRLMSRTAVTCPGYETPNAPR